MSKLKLWALTNLWRREPTPCSTTVNVYRYSRARKRRRIAACGNRMPGPLPRACKRGITTSGISCRPLKRNP
eukprot:7455233-Lingulodinium_polyedra.AAC.1